MHIGFYLYINIFFKIVIKLLIKKKERKQKTELFSYSFAPKKNSNERTNNLNVLI